VLKIDHSSFISNNATTKGGAIYYNYRNPVLTNITFESNEAKYGPNLASYPVRIGSATDPNDPIRITNVGSGILIEPAINLALLDYDNQVMVLDETSQILFAPQNSSASSISGTNSELVRNGISAFDGLIATAHPGDADVVFVASSKSIDHVKVAQVFGSEVSESLIKLDFRYCQPGEQIVGDK
jgi:hypothetical protein